MPASKESAAVLKDLLVFYDRLAEQAGHDRQVMLQSLALNPRFLSAADARLTSPPDPRTWTAVARDLSEPYRYELARTLYFLSSKCPSAAGSAGGSEAIEEAAQSKPHESLRNEYRDLAIGMLNELTSKNTHAPDYQFLLALCHRPSVFGSGQPAVSSMARGRQQAIRILEKLTSRHPHVADYRYELAVTYAWFPVGLFPWQSRLAASAEAEQNLLRALDESHRLVSQNPTIPRYAGAQALILAKLGMVYWGSHRLAEAEEFFRQAVQTQCRVIQEFPDLPSHQRVLLRIHATSVRAGCPGARGRHGQFPGVGRSA
ncbi:MAG: hypothetical protein A2W31_16435 [Planctomycetes bacterium RBG_16_64_10]|nr:MAG: hypothetical protein A2W31_16435 [Planctomycetes bacterium RBG_16_64_10]